MIRRAFNLFSILITVAFSVSLWGQKEPLAVSQQVVITLMAVEYALFRVKKEQLLDKEEKEL